MNTFYSLTFSIVALFANAQVSYLRINPDINLPKDSLECKQLISSLQDFITSAQKPNEENKLVLASEKIETFILLDEIRGIEKNKKLKDDSFYKPYLTNIVPLKKNQYFIQFSYIGMDETGPILRGSFNIIAHKYKDSFLFTSPLLINTRHWKTEQAGNNIFHYQDTINRTKVREFNDQVAAFDLKLKSKDKITEFYCCDNISELQKLVGVDYKSDYNGFTESVWSSSSGNRKVCVLGDNNATFNGCDPHDTWHSRLSFVVARNKVNKPVDEGCAYLYGGSWGLSWNEIFKSFKEQIAINKNTSWLDVKETPVYFKTKGFSNSADHIVNALLVQKIEKEKGFEGVWELLNVGPVEKGNEKYFATLERLTGITKASYNDAIWQLISQQQ
jgi:hypothetical protein